MKTRIIIFFTLITTFFLFAARDMITWADWYNTDDSDEIFSIKQTADSGYIAAGYYYYELSQDWHMIHGRLLRLDKHGEVIWDKGYCYVDSYLSSINSIIENSEGDFIAVGLSEYYGGQDYSIMVLKFDKDGNLLWQKFYGSGDSEGNDVKETPDGGYIIAGRESINDSVKVASLLKVNANGDSLWTLTRESEGEGSSHFNSVIVSSDNCLVTSGGHGLPGIVIKTDLNGIVQWEKNYNVAPDSTVWSTNFKAIAEDNFGNFICCGSISEDALIMKFDQNGDSLWTKFYNKDTFKYGIKVADKTYDDNFIAAGYYQCSDTEEQWKIMKFDSNGDSLWTTTSRSVSKNFINWPGEIHPTFDGGYIVGGDLGRSYIMKLNEYGEVGIMENGQFTIDNYKLAQNYPNPFNNMTTIEYALEKISDVKISVFNTQGQKVSELVNNKVGKGKHSVLFDGSRFNSGVYYYQLNINDETVDNKKMIYVK
ncbi:MAG: T9SS type A sorting domain-containing protein [Candidatus Delongbacteria bacterium]|jgi:hypothetical protein|nr:T9SS type A sorting domain-containing protein [Candidatus Delongbacteria bacterium]